MEESKVIFVQQIPAARVLAALVAGTPRRDPRSAAKGKG